MGPRPVPDATSVGQKPESNSKQHAPGPVGSDPGRKSDFGRPVQRFGPSPTSSTSTNRSTPIQEQRVKVWKRETPKKDRKCLGECYEKEVSGRERWWRKDIRITPVPGAYEVETFLRDFETRPATYTFKNEGRKKEADVLKKGEYLLPGAYKHQGFLYDLNKSRNTYSFKNSTRSALPVVKDKDVNISPDKYGIEKHLSTSVKDSKNKNATFKSSSKRFPTIHFKGTSNPAPCHYESRSPKVPHTVTSSFKSRTPRFSTAHTKVPGPGTYDSVFQYPMPRTISKMGRNHGLFFTSSFQA